MIERPVQREKRVHGRLAALTAAVEEHPVRGRAEEIALPRIGLDAEPLGERYAVQGEPEVLSEPYHYLPLRWPPGRLPAPPRRAPGPRPARREAPATQGRRGRSRLVAHPASL